MRVVKANLPGSRASASFLNISANALSWFKIFLVTKNLSIVVGFTNATHLSSTIWEDLNSILQGNVHSGIGIKASHYQKAKKENEPLEVSHIIGQFDRSVSKHQQTKGLADRINHAKESQQPKLATPANALRQLSE